MAADNTVTLVLNGDVSLEEFSKAIGSFAELIKALSAESGDPTMDWIVQDLQVSSSMATAAVLVGEEEKIQAVINGYADVGSALENKTDIKHSEAVKVAARKIISITDKRVRSVSFDTEKRAALVRLHKPEIEVPSAAALPVASSTSSYPLQVVRAAGAAYGAVQGRIQTLTNRGNLRFTLFDLHYDKAVSCYFAEGKQEAILGLWGKLATVEGYVTRDPLTGRPLSIRQVDNITPLAESESPYDYQQARGVAPSLTGLSAVDAIRRIRDAQ